METRANYVLIGAFAVAGFLGILAFFFWFANISLDRQFSYYDIDFESVSGLGEASDVRFAGLPVGQVVDVRLSPERDGTVRARIEIDANTPVRTDSVATIESQGVTGVSFVGLTAGTPEAPLLSQASSQEVPIIEAGPSVLQSLSQDAPALLQETLAVVRDLRELTGGENQQRMQTILENVEQASIAFSSTLSNFALEIERFNTTLNTLTTDASSVLNSAAATLESLRELSEDARQAVAQGGDTLTGAQGVIASADRYLLDELGPATEQLKRSVAEIETRFAGLSDRAGGLIDTYAETGDLAAQRLVEAQGTLASTEALMSRIEETLAIIDTAALRFDGLIVDSAEPLIAELRTATAEATSVIRTIDATAGTDLPAILDDVRTATATASDVVTRVGEDLSAASGRLDALSRNAGETLDAARETFANANATLSSINAALDTGDRTLRAAERAFEGADRVLNEDAAEIADRLRATLDQVEAAVGAIADEVPGVTEQVRAASRSAQSAFAQIESAVEDSAPPVRDFAATALPQYARLAAETRALVDNLDTLIEQIRRNPSRFFLDPRAPEYSR